MAFEPSDRTCLAILYRGGAVSYRSVLNWHVPDTYDMYRDQYYTLHAKQRYVSTKTITIYLCVLIRIAHPEQQVAGQ